VAEALALVHLPLCGESLVPSKYLALLCGVNYTPWRCPLMADCPARNLWPCRESFDALMKIRTRIRRIGITGSARAGKTVFLLSLINHLTVGLDLGGGKTRRFRPLPCKRWLLPRLLARLPGANRLFSDERREFKYDGLRRHLAHNKEWPHKTTDSSFFPLPIPSASG